MLDIDNNINAIIDINEDFNEYEDVGAYSSY